MMVRLIVAAAMTAMATMLSAGVVQAQSGPALSANDPKYDTPRCRAARSRVERYARKNGKDRFFVQSAWFLALGSWVPPGTYDPTPEQRRLARDLRKYCVSKQRR